MVNMKIDKKALLKAVRDAAKPKKANFTFRLKSDLYALFKEQCEKDKVNPTAIIEKFLEEYTK